MLMILFIILMFGVFGKMIGFAFRATWGLTRMLVNFILFPVFLIAMVFAGLIYIAVPMLIIAAIILLVGKKS